MTPPSDGVPPRQVSEDLLLVELPGLRVLIEAACPHRKGRLRFGYVNSRTGRITCPLHHSSFDLRTGRPLAGPACRPLRVTVLPVDPPPADPAGELATASSPAQEPAGERGQ